MVDPATVSLLASTGGNLASGLGSIFGGNAQARAAARAAEEAARVQREALEFQKGVYSTAQGQYDPYITAGTQGLGQFQTAIQDYTQPELGYTQKDFAFDTFSDPGAQYRMSEAQKAIQGSAAAKGGALGSGALKSLQTRSQDMASQEYANAYDRWLKDSQLRYDQASNQYGRDINFANQNISNLGNLATMGSTAIGNLGNLGAGIGSSIQTGAANLGETLAGGTLAGGQSNAAGWNTLGGGLKNLFNDLGTYYGSQGSTYPVGDYTRNSSRLGVA